MHEGSDAGTFFSIDTPYLVVCEAKKQDTVGLRESKAEILGQIRNLMKKRYLLLTWMYLHSPSNHGMTGILTDGYHWRFFHYTNDFDVFYMELDAVDKGHEYQLLRTSLIVPGAYQVEILSLLVAGQWPSGAEDNPLLLVRDDEMT